MSLEAFANTFPELEVADTKVLTVTPDSVYHHRGIPPGQYALMDYFCVDPKCDCRRVSLAVMDISPNKRTSSLVTISYGFDRNKEMAGPFIDPLNPCCAFGKALFEEVKSGPLQDPAYVKLLERHYYMLKDAIGADVTLTYRRADPAVTQQIIAKKNQLKKERANLLRSKLDLKKQKQRRRPR